MRLVPAARALVVSAALLSGLVAAPAEAAVTSTGVRCTVVGTGGADVLVGTPARDVICARAGDDVVRGRGGNDLVDAGAGADRVLGGSGDDHVIGGLGRDRVYAGDGDDRIGGGGGVDVLVGAGGSDRVVGGDGDDRVDGGALGDTVAGQGGADLVIGGDGADRVSGQAGDDDLMGGGGADHLDGQIGDDYLDGGSGRDALDGGAGINRCSVDAGDESVRCRYDETAPVVLETRLSPSSVDVTERDVPVTIRVRASDDTGIEDVQVQLHDADFSVQLLGPPAVLRSGDARDGWWETTFEVARYTRPADLRPLVIVRDRLDRQTFDDSSSARLRVVDANPDTETPRMTLLAPLPPRVVDVRSRPVDVTVRVRATDLSGVARLDLCLTRLDRDHARPMYVDVTCREGVPRTEGTIHDGVYTTVLRLPQGSPGGDYNVEAYATDLAQTGLGVRFMGPDAYPTYVESGASGPEPQPFPDGAGRLEVLGADNTTRPWVGEVTLTPAQVDTFTTGAVTRVEVRAHDAPGEGVSRVVAVLVAGSDSVGAPQFDQVDLALAAGDAVDGIWAGDLLLPQGTPPGRYDVLVFVSDVSFTRSYTGVGSSYADDPGYATLASDPHAEVVQHQP